MFMLSMIVGQHILGSLFRQAVKIVVSCGGRRHRKSRPMVSQPLSRRFFTTADFDEWSGLCKKCFCSLALDRPSLRKNRHHCTILNKHHAKICILALVVLSENGRNSR